MPSTTKSLFVLIKSDLYRYEGKSGLGDFLFNFAINRGFKFSIYYRVGHLLWKKKSILFKAFSIFYHFKCNKYTINISLKSSIGYGLYISHPYAIAISKYAVLGNNINISQNVTIGQKQSKTSSLAPIIGDNVYIGPGALLIGRIKIADYSVIAGNAIVTRDVPENAIVAGNAAQIISYKGSAGLINNVFIK